jgi:hypothetical protein
MSARGLVHGLGYNLHALPVFAKVAKPHRLSDRHLLAQSNIDLAVVLLYSLSLHIILGRMLMTGRTADPDVDAMVSVVAFPTSEPTENSSLLHVPHWTCPSAVYAHAREALTLVIYVIYIYMLCIYIYIYMNFL